MCGIVGLAGVTDPGLVREMNAAVLHRGPDGEGYFDGESISLGMRRLSIIDILGSDQPICNEDGSVVTIFNGEIFNFRELRTFLEKKGHKLRTAGDTEVLVHLYEEYGDASVGALRGMYAYAIWDRARRQLVLFRDRLGIKPLYYAQVGGVLAFASELKALLRVPAVKRDLDMDAVALYLSLQYVPGPRTILGSIKKLPPGHFLVWRDGHVTIRRYWDVVLDEGERRLDEDAAADEFRTLLEETMALHAVSDVPLGVLLSGGIDSAAVTGLLARSLPRVKTFTVGFDAGRQTGELEQARIVARHFDTEHHEVVVGHEIADALPRIVGFQDEPIADPAAIPTYFVCKFAARAVKVVLTGEGGDELLGGYPRYGWLRLGERIRRWTDRVPGLARAAGRVEQRWEHRRALSRIGTLLSDAPLIDRHLQWTAAISESLQYELRARSTGARGWGTARDLLATLMERSGESTVHDLMYLDFKTWLPDDVLMKTDRMSMAVSVEARVPFLDHRLVEFAMSLPSSVKVKSLGTKALLRRALRDRWPASTLKRRKRAFLVPLRRWLTSDLHEMMVDTLTSSAARSRSLFDRNGVDALIRDQGSARPHRSRALWTLLCLELWFQEVLSAPAAHHR
jgi:asparagine synthase (glutamine-hydrolysing)